MGGIVGMGRPAGVGPPGPPRQPLQPFLRGAVHAQRAVRDARRDVHLASVLFLDVALQLSSSPSVFVNFRTVTGIV